MRKKTKSNISKNIAIYLAIAGNIAVGIVKFIAAAISGSASMVSEGIHSIVDSGNGILVLVGINTSKKQADYLHPFGYGKNLYFWTLIVSLLIFLLGGCVSIIHGARYLYDLYLGQLEEISPFINYCVIIVSMIIEGYTLFKAVKTLNDARGNTKVFTFIRDTPDPSLFTVVFEDTVAEFGLFVALIGNVVSDITGNACYDGIASIVIGILLCLVAASLLIKTKGLLIGEGLGEDQVDKIRDIVENNDQVEACGRILTMYMGPENLLITIDVTFKERCKAYDILKATDDIEKDIYKQIPKAEKVFIEAENLDSVKLQQKEEDKWEKPRQLIKD